MDNLSNNVSKTQSDYISLGNFDTNDINVLKSAFFSNDNIDEIRRYFDDVFFKISFFDYAIPEKSFSKYIMVNEAQKLLPRKDFILAVADAILDKHHYSINRIKAACGDIFLSTFM